MQITIKFIHTPVQCQTQQHIQKLDHVDGRG